MATSAFIGRVGKNGKFVGSHVNYDGYESQMLPLLANYETDEEVDALLALGNLSELGADTDSCVAYHRDRGERFRRTFLNSLEDAKAEYFYFYIFVDGSWLRRESAIKFFVQEEANLNAKVALLENNNNVTLERANKLFHIQLSTYGGYFFDCYTKVKNKLIYVDGGDFRGDARSAVTSVMFNSLQGV